LAETTAEHWMPLLDKALKVSPDYAYDLYRLVKAFLNYALAQAWLPADPLPRRPLQVLRHGGPWESGHDDAGAARRPADVHLFHPGWHHWPGQDRHDA
jgi:hypothetical protein